MQVFKLHPDAVMREALDRNCDYRRYCWNQGLELWNDLYMAHTIFDKVTAIEFIPKQNKKNGKWSIAQHSHHLNPAPNWRMVRDMMVEQKEDWQYSYSARILQLAVQDLGKAWKNFFDKSQPNWGKPRFKSKKYLRQGFKSDQAKIEDGCLILEKPQGYKGEWHPIPLGKEPKGKKFGVVSIVRKKHGYYACVPFKDIKEKVFAKTSKYTGVDVNVGHFNYLNGKELVIPKSLFRHYKKIKHYQRSLAKKRVANGRIEGTKSKRYQETRAKLQGEYAKIKDIQTDLMHKLTYRLVKDYDQIVVEDLNVKGMFMSHVASKGMHRSMFGLFRKLISYKCDWHGKKLIVADRLYPSTQRCYNCGYVKKDDEKIGLQGNKKHGTRHNQYICYKCGYKNDRDDNAMLNLTYLVKHPELNHAL